MLTQDQKNSLIRDVLYSFKLQKGMTFVPSNFDLYVDKPDERSLCSIYVYSKRQDDNFRLKLYVTGFSVFTTIENFIFTQEQNYTTGLNDEVHVSNCTLSKSEFRSFEMYLYSQQYAQDILTATDYLLKEDNSIGFLLENGTGRLVAEH